MSHGIMVCDVPFYRDLTKVNVHAFLACKLVCIEKLEKLSTVLEIDQSYEFLISVTTLNNRDITNDVIKIKNSLLPKAPLIFLGHWDNPQAEIGHIKSPFDQIEMIKFIIKKLGWAPSDLVGRKLDSFIPIPISLIENTNTAMEDLFFYPQDQPDKLVAGASKGDNIADLKTQWKKIKIETFYIQATKRLTVVGIINAQAIKNTSDAIKSNDVNLQQKTVAQNMSVLSETLSDSDFFNKLPEDLKEQTGELAKETNELLEKTLNKMSPMINGLIQSFRSNEKGHVQQLSFLSMHITTQMIQNESWYTLAVAEKVRYIHFFNNLMLIPIVNKYPNIAKEKILTATHPDLTQKEKDMIRWHPKIIGSMVGDMPGLPLGLDQIIMQHHGNPHGDSTSTELFEDISLLAKVIFISESFCELLLSAEFPISESVKTGIISKLEEKIKRRSFAKLIENLKKLQI
ncbi:MAG: hypothetical protein QE271_03585 [Bacteriovoracaceae bacterium]|nr:hypothetical protein [Bacteriovoracaceae bacterium]